MAVTLDDDQSAYRAGACNIGPEEMAARRRIGVVQLLLAVLIGAGLVALDTPAWTRLAVWPLLAAAFTTLEQVRRRFCVAFGFAGLRNFGAIGRAERIEDAAARAADRRAALVMVTYCALAAAAVTALFVASPG
ncbi:MAG TPA: hypothetical protein VK867_11660 [Candidatus Limnocylindrales bacterium]|nr:hypothetical protein [Candidatus Limnocylindrales bacterium]